MKTVQDCKASPHWPAFAKVFEDKVGRIGARDATLIVSCFHWFAVGMDTANAEWAKKRFAEAAAVSDYDIPPPGTPPDIANALDRPPRGRMVKSDRPGVGMIPVCIHDAHPDRCEACATGMDGEDD